MPEKVGTTLISRYCRYSTYLAELFFALLLFEITLHVHHFPMIKSHNEETKQ
jgi:hypothetical protein